MAARVYRRAVGEVALTAMQDARGRWAPRDILRPEVEADLAPWAHLLDPDGATELSMTVYLLESRGVRVLVDTGLADQPMPRRPMDEDARLFDCLAEAGVDPRSIDLVVHTHLHFDHVGWNARREGGAWVPAFPNARHLIQRPDWEHWVRGEPGFPGPDLERSIRPIEAAGMVELLDGDRELTPEVTALAAYGHTPGHQAVWIASGGESACIVGDSCHVAMQVCETGWSDRADVDHAQGDRTRDALMRRAEAEGAIVIGGHFPFPGLGRRAARGGRCAYEPLAD